MAVTVRIHGLEQAELSLASADELGITIALATADAAAVYAGAAFWRAVELALDRTIMIDCGAVPGVVMTALRVGCRAVLFTGEPPVAAKLAALAVAHGATLHAEIRPPVVSAPPEAGQRWLHAALHDTARSLVVGDSPCR